MFVHTVSELISQLNNEILRLQAEIKELKGTKIPSEKIAALKVAMNEAEMAIKLALAHGRVFTVNTQKIIEKMQVLLSSIENVDDDAAKEGADKKDTVVATTLTDSTTATTDIPTTDVSHESGQLKDKEIAELRAEISAIFIEEVRQVKEAAIEEINELHRDRAALRAENYENTKYAISLNECIRHLSGNIGKLHIENDRLATDNKAKNKETASLYAIIMKLQAEIVKLKIDIREKDKECLDVIDHARNNTVDLARENVMLSDDIKTKDRIIKKIQAEVKEQSDANNKAAEQEIMKLHARIAKLENRNSSLSKMVLDKGTEYSGYLVAANKEKEAAEKKAKILEAEIDAKTHAFAKENDLLHKKLDEAQVEALEAYEWGEELQKKNTALGTEYMNLITARNGNLHQIKALEETTDVLRAKLEITQKHAQEYFALLEKKQAKIDSLKGRK